jgi:hypothetical protein
MTKAKTLAAAAVVWSIFLMAAGVTFRRYVPPQPSTENDFDERWMSIKKGDRLPLPAPTPLAGQSEVPTPVASTPERLPHATEDDIRQADAEYHRHRDICPHGRTYFIIEHHQYWRIRRPPVGEITASITYDDADHRAGLRRDPSLLDGYSSGADDSSRDELAIPPLKLLLPSLEKGVHHLYHHHP